MARPESWVSQASQVLVDAERALRGIVSAAADAGDYDGLVMITRWAKGIQALAADRETKQAGDRPSVKSKPASPISRADTGGQGSAVVFCRDSDMLVKRAKARKTKADYEHRAPALVLRAVVEVLSLWRPDRKLLTGDEMLAACSEKKAPVVSYQLYVVLGWLQQQGLIRRHGRSGYSVPEPARITVETERAWRALPDAASA
jgi:hypothetical protein